MARQLPTAVTSVGCAARSMFSASRTSNSVVLAAGVLDVDEHGAARNARGDHAHRGTLAHHQHVRPALGGGLTRAGARRLRYLLALATAFLAAGLRALVLALAAGLLAFARRTGFFFIATCVYCQGRGVLVKGSGGSHAAARSGVAPQRIEPGLFRDVARRSRCVGQRAITP